MSNKRYIKGEIVHDTRHDVWVQFIEENDGEVRLFNGLKYSFSDIIDIKKAELPLALDGLGFKLIRNNKKGTEKYKLRTYTIDLIDENYFIHGQRVTNIVEVQLAFNMFDLITFYTLERRLSGYRHKGDKINIYA